MGGEKEQEGGQTCFLAFPAQLQVYGWPLALLQEPGPTS